MKVIRLINPQFQDALMKLSNQELALESAKTVLSVLRTVQQMAEEYHDGRIKFMSKLAEQDEDGNPKLDENGNFIFPEENKEKIGKKMKEMMDKEVQVPSIQAARLEGAKLSAQELSLLEDVIV